MNGYAWHARIVCGKEVGAGFLVSGRRVLTCAHVVRCSDTAKIAVTFPGRRDLDPVPASVAVHGGWRGGVTDPGDLAVLELAWEVPVAPAVFAPPGAERGSPRLVAYGFPKGYDEGMLAEYRALPGPLIAGEWVQLEALTGHGQPLAAGFSGAAVTLDDETVVGMVAAVAGDRGVRVGRMLPTEVMARYWDELGELVPTPGHHADARRRLYALVRRAGEAGLRVDPDRLYVDAVGPFGPPLPEGGFGSTARAAAYVQWEVPDPEAVTAFADRLADLLDARDGRARPAGPGAPDAAWSPIVVEIEHSGAGADQVTVEVSAYRDGHRRPVGARRLPRTGVRAYVQERIDAAFTQLAPDAEELITFVLPREWLNEPVARWECSPDDPTPLGCAYPLVVADRARHRSGRLRHQLAKKWQKLDVCGGTAPHRVDCSPAERPPSLRKRLRDHEAAVAAYAAPPTAVRQHFEAGLNVPVPILLWPRAGCPGSEHDGPCPGEAFLDELTESVTGVPPGDLPRHVRTLRETAEAADEPDRHWARDLQLLWDDPRCFPEPAACLHSPVEPVASLA
ncbi:trypsin-like peptidase domain-containing protein [Streptomyces sp. JB150]|uniref:VMAP-C domain-containing protein n=1 Tax=Streptomyces sp. JB150 TaxID=2714844 RepID=UPI00140B64D9|nr:trypsin-like peptidase domain-containing protein [Streptomyces sp. JB150]QIJ62423.1 trypsin-like peptidase domain-containing protein [Streptomyces sp. JB150]